MMGHYDECRDSTHAAEARAALTRRATNEPGTVRSTTPIEQAYSRVGEARQRVLDVASRARATADNLIGEQPEAPRSTGERLSPMPDVGGGVGNLLIEINQLELALDEAWRQVSRLTVLAE